MTTTTALILVAVILIAVIVAFLMIRKERSRKLRAHFGPEYERATQLYGGPAKAEAALADRQKRVEKLQIRPLSNNERERFASLWHDAQARFVDDPSASIHEADRLLTDVMVARGYPMADFERQAEDISVDYPDVVSNYRVAHAIAASEQQGAASTEDLRRAVVCYRKLFEELLDAHVAPRR